MRLLCWPLFLVVFLAAGPNSAPAGMITLTYSGVNEDNSYISAVGLGSFSFTSGATSLTLGDLTGFSFTQTTTLADPNLSGSSTYTYGLADLVSFAATLSATGTVTALKLQTKYVNASNGFLNPQYLVVGSLGRNGTTFYQSGRDGDVTTGTVIAATSVPEPASLLLTGWAGIVSLGGVAGRRWMSTRTGLIRG